MEGIARVDGDLVISERHGFAYQRDMVVTARYDEGYFGKCAGYEDGAIARAINAGRIDLVAKHVGPTFPVCDVGIGSGEFIRRRGNTWGTDVNPFAVEWLKERGLLADDLSAFRAFTFWDVIEHVPDPEAYFRHAAAGSYLFTSVPIFADLSRVRDSKHYRPGEHLFYFTLCGFVQWMSAHGFDMLECDTFEMDAGRENIYSFAFRRRA